MISQAEENYLKAIFKLTEAENRPASTNALAAEMATAAPSVTDMLKRLAAKGFIFYEKHRGVTLSELGQKTATELVRKHRLWEVFLVEKLGFGWESVHDLAEQLEHVHGEGLTGRLDKFLGYPKFDPHGDPIPDAEGRFHRIDQLPLARLEAGQSAVVTGVNDHSPVFLKFLEKNGLQLGTALQFLEKTEFDGSVKIKFSDGREALLSEKVCANLFVKLV